MSLCVCVCVCLWAQHIGNACYLFTGIPDDQQRSVLPWAENGTEAPPHTWHAFMGANRALRCVCMCRL